MAAIKEIIAKEGERSEPRHYTEVHLYQEGSFMRAYEWSAYLLCKYVHEFKVTHRAFKDIETSVAFVGFPKTSLEKYTPTNAQTETIEEKHKVVSLPIDADEETVKQMKEDFVKWKEQIPITDTSKEKRTETKTDTQHQLSLTAVMQRILSFPLENKSPIDCMLFLADIRMQLAKMI